MPISAAGSQAAFQRGIPKTYTDRAQSACVMLAEQRQHAALSCTILHHPAPSSPPVPCKATQNCAELSVPEVKRRITALLFPWPSLRFVPTGTTQESEANGFWRIPGRLSASPNWLALIERRPIIRSSKGLVLVARVPPRRNTLFDVVRKFFAQIFHVPGHVDSSMLLSGPV